MIAWLALVPTTTSAEDRLVREFSRGSGQNTVGIVDGGVDTEIGGPQALSVDDDGQLFLLDQVNGRILRFDPRNPTADATELKLPERYRADRLGGAKAKYYGLGWRYPPDAGEPAGSAIIPKPRRGQHKVRRRRVRQVRVRTDGFAAAG